MGVNDLITGRGGGSHSRRRTVVGSGGGAAGPEILNGVRTGGIDEDRRIVGAGNDNGVGHVVQRNEEIATVAVATLVYGDEGNQNFGTVFGKGRSGRGTLLEGDLRGGGTVIGRRGQRTVVAEVKGTIIVDGFHDRIGTGDRRRNGVDQLNVEVTRNKITGLVGGRQGDRDQAGFVGDHGAGNGALGDGYVTGILTVIGRLGQVGVVRNQRRAVVVNGQRRVGGANDRRARSIRQFHGNLTHGLVAGRVRHHDCYHLRCAEPTQHRSRNRTLHLRQRPVLRARRAAIVGNHDTVTVVGQHKRTVRVGGNHAQRRAGQDGRRIVAHRQHELAVGRVSVTVVGRQRDHLGTEHVLQCSGDGVLRDRRCRGTVIGGGGEAGVVRNRGLAVAVDEYLLRGRAGDGRRRIVLQRKRERTTRCVAVTVVGRQRDRLGRVVTAEERRGRQHLGHRNIGRRRTVVIHHGSAVVRHPSLTTGVHEDGLRGRANDRRVRIVLQRDRGQALRGVAVAVIGR